MSHPVLAVNETHVRSKLSNSGGHTSHYTLNTDYIVLVLTSIPDTEKRTALM